MMKRIFALLICLATLLTAFVGCAQRDPDDKGQFITMYLTDNIYDLDPANAYNNDALANVVGLLFDTLFTLDTNGKVKPSLVKDYWVEENENAQEYKMFLRLRDTNWSDGTAVTADDIVFAWTRLLEVDADFEAAALLYDIKNARACKEGSNEKGESITVDDVAIYASETTLLEIQFEGKIDYDHFLLNLTSVALTPLRDDVVDKKANPQTKKNEDWAKKGTTMVCSGPFKVSRINWMEDTSTRYQDHAYVDVSENGFEIVGQKKFVSQYISDFVLERNQYYYRDYTEDSLFKSVTPYRICVDCSLTDEQIKEAYEAGMIMYIGDIPMSLREDAMAKDAVVADYSMSTSSIYFNTNAVVDDGSKDGAKLFADAKVRQALSMAIDREALQKAVVFAEVATGLIPTGVYEANSSKTSFREACSTSYDALKYNTDGAKELLKDINPKKYSFTLTVAAYDEIHCAMAEIIKDAWCELGFDVTIEKRGTIANNDFYNPTQSVPVDICDDLYAEDLKAGRFQAIILDYCAYTPDPYSMLAPFATAFSGRAMDMSNHDSYELTPHITGFQNTEYNELMEKIFNQKTIADRADDYRAAEAILMEEMPIVPLLFNLNASISSDSLSKVSNTYYIQAHFQKSTIKNYEEYLAAGRSFIEDDYNYASLAFHQSKDCTYGVDPMPEGGESNKKWDRWLEEYEAMFKVFKGSNSVYAHFFAEKAEETSAS